MTDLIFALFDYFLKNNICRERSMIPENMKDRIVRN